MFCAAYADKPMWLSPSVAPFMIESYSMAMRIRIVTAYNLTPDEGTVVQTAFAYHYAKLLGIPDDTNVVPMLLNRCGFLGSITEITTRLAVLNDASPNGDCYENGLSTLCLALATAGPSRMEKFTLSTVFQSFSMGNLDTMSLALAIDYPPYWAYLLCKQIAGSKNTLLSMLFRLAYMKRALPTFVKAFTGQRDLVHKR